MDMAICNINPSAGYLDFAGANRPLWIVRQNELLEFKPDKFPLGGLQFSKKEKFTSHHILIQPGDSIYMSTDGFADQFGGAKGKKMMTKMMKEVLLSIQNLSMEEQQKYLLKYFHDWKGGEDQVDDVLVLGLKI